MILEGFGLFVEDMGTMIRFYRDVMGFEITEPEGTQTIFFLENDDYFWAIAFYSSTMEYEAAKARAFELIGCFEIIEE